MFKLLVLSLISFTLLGMPSLVEIDNSFNDISKKYDIPSEILKAIAYQKTGWFINTSVDNEDDRGEYGIMGLSMDNIDLGISLLGKDDSFDAISDYKVNIEVAAKIISSIKEDLYRDGAIITNIEDYEPVLVEFISSQYNMLARNHVRKMFNLISTGYDIKIADKIITINPAVIDYTNIDNSDISLFYKSYTSVNSLEDIDTHYSPNKSSRDGVTVDQIIVHIMQGTFSGSESWFMNRSSSVSSHYLISTEGEILQMVKLSDKAWHAGTHNSRSVGIEHEGFSGSDVHSDTVITEAEYQASAMVSRWLTERYNIPRVHIDAYISPYHVNATISNRTGILGHNDASGKPHCPGANWDWNRYLGLINNGNRATTSGTLTLLSPRNNSNINNPVVFTSRVTGDITNVKYYADRTFLLGESSTASNNFYFSYRFNGIGDRVVSAKGFDSRGNYVSNTEVVVNINIQNEETRPEPHCTNECTLNRNECRDSYTVRRCVEDSSGCTVWQVTDSCSSDETCTNGYCKADSNNNSSGGSSGTGNSGGCNYSNQSSSIFFLFLLAILSIRFYNRKKIYKK